MNRKSQQFDDSFNEHFVEEKLGIEVDRNDGSDSDSSDSDSCDGSWKRMKDLLAALEAQENEPEDNSPSGPMTRGKRRRLGLRKLGTFQGPTRLREIEAPLPLVEPCRHKESHEELAKRYSESPQKMQARAEELKASSPELFNQRLLDKPHLAPKPEDCVPSEAWLKAQQLSPREVREVMKREGEMLARMRQFPFRKQFVAWLNRECPYDALDGLHDVYTHFALCSYYDPLFEKKGDRALKNMSVAANWHLNE